MAWRARISHQLHEVRLLFAGETTEPVNENLLKFINNNYASLKTLNPKFNFLIRNVRDGEPLLIARYGWGHEEAKEIRGLSESQINDALKDLVLLGDKYPKSWPIHEEWPWTVIDATSSTADYM